MRTLICILILCLSVQAEGLRPRRPTVKHLYPAKVPKQVVDVNGNRSLAPASLAFDDTEYRVTLKLIEGTRPRINPDWTIYSLADSNLTTVNSVIAQHSPTRVWRMSYKSPEAVDSQWTTRMERIQHRSGSEVLADLNTYFYVSVVGADNAEQLITDLNTLDIVEIAYWESNELMAGSAVDIPPTTPNFDSTSYWLLPAPYGMGGEWAHRIPGGDGAGVRLTHVEERWLLENVATNDSAHEDVPISTADLVNYADTIAAEGSWCWNHDQPLNHSQSIAGLIYAQDNGYGITGMAPGCEYRLQSALHSEPPFWLCTTGSRDMNAAYEHAIDESEPGDVITTSVYNIGAHPVRSDTLDWWPAMIVGWPACTLTVDCDTLRLLVDGYGGHPNFQFGYLPTEWAPAAYDIIAGAYADGVIFCELAGNGWINIDDTVYYGNGAEPQKSLFDTTYRNSHAVIVGMGWAGRGWVDPFTDSVYPLNSRVWRSNYSSTLGRVNLFAHSPQGGCTGNWNISEDWVGTEAAESSDSGRHFMQIPGLPFDDDSLNGWDKKQYYTRGFDGTSAATPLIAAAIACYQGAYKAAHNDSVLTGDSIVAIFQATGTPEQPDDSGYVWGIGVMPDLKAAFIATGLGPEGVEATNTAATGVTIAQ